MQKREVLFRMLGVLESEARVWGEAGGGWRPLFGRYATLGLSLEWHELRLEEDLVWSRSFHEGSLEICLNFTGGARLVAGGRSLELGAEEVGLYSCRRGFLEAVRPASSLHRFLTLEVSSGYLRTVFAADWEGLRPEVRVFAADPDGASIARVERMPAWMVAERRLLLEPPVAPAAARAWYEGKAQQLLAALLFQQPAPVHPASRHRRLTRERVERARALLERDLENPPTLPMLAEAVGGSPFTLSRSFAEETGLSIPKYLRKRRIERAAQLLASGQANVTEAAFQVGYSSLSAFHKAFTDEFGCCPGLYPKQPLANK